MQLNFAEMSSPSPDPLPTIGSVSESLGLEPHVVRYWESEFEQLSPAKDEQGRRVYTEDDIATLNRIYHLLKVEKYTLAGARQVLERGRKASLPDMSEEDLRELQTFLQDILEQIDP